MPDSVNRRIVDRILMGPPGRRRQLQDSPILPDVWFAYADDPRARQELLLTPHYQSTASTVALDIARNLQWENGDGRPENRRITPLHGVVAAAIGFPELMWVAIPKTAWWQDIVDRTGPDRRTEALARDIVRRMDAELGRYALAPLENEIPVKYAQFLYLCGLILASPESDWGTFTEGEERVVIMPEVNEAVYRNILHYLSNLRPKEPPQEDADRDVPPRPVPKIWSISQNRVSEMSLEKSVPAIKADATRNLFNIDCSEIVWAVIDSGIDREHPAFRDSATGRKRVVATYDFACIRDVANVDFQFLPDHLRAGRIENLAETFGLEPAAVARILEKLSADMEEGMELNWDLIEPFLAARRKADSYRLDHGTHVAGIIGANWVAADGSIRLQGVCPDIRLYDMRVIGDDLVQTESALIAAMQFIRHLNSRTNRQVIHGANISLSIPHNVRNYACGSTPVCIEAESLAANGVCVVAAAGNRGYQNFETAGGPVFASYAAFSITDPGNAEGVITVGSTHRNWPHTYGVSFFSSRGPTGDGRLKPDLVAPGEKILSAAPDEGEAVMDGTSMAAPHVSGAAALLMARYPEMIGQTARIKKILKDNATDLGRERSFQGAGMLDILRSIQAV